MTNKAPDRSNDKGKSPATPTPNTNTSNRTNSGSAPSNSGAAKATSDLTSKLGKDGKLTQQEQQCLFEQILCVSSVAKQAT